eukprot:Sdes_comp9019_c0_seq1m440
MKTPTSSPLQIVVNFGGGAEFLVDGIKQHTLSLPCDSEMHVWTLQALLFYIRDHILKERVDLFMQGDSIRPGILVLVNDSDWELLGELEYELQNNDSIFFVSTLHGG